MWDCCPGPAAEEGATPSPEQTVPPHLGTSTASPWRQLGMELLTPPHREPKAGSPSPGTLCNTLCDPCLTQAKKAPLLITEHSGLQLWESGTVFWPSISSALFQHSFSGNCYWLQSQTGYRARWT